MKTSNRVDVPLLILMLALSLLTMFVSCAANPELLLRFS